MPDIALGKKTPKIDLHLTGDKLAIELMNMRSDLPMPPVALGGKVAHLASPGGSTDAANGHRPFVVRRPPG